ncbi:hypothetical protein Tco_1083934, partial [Tanacetum coccineum]
FFGSFDSNLKNNKMASSKYWSNIVYEDDDSYSESDVSFEEEDLTIKCPQIYTSNYYCICGPGGHCGSDSDSDQGRNHFVTRGGRCPP